MCVCVCVCVYIWGGLGGRAEGGGRGVGGWGARGRLGREAYGLGWDEGLGLG